MPRTRIAIITGAGGSLGGALAKKLDRRGISLILVDNNLQALLDVTSQLKNKHHTLCYDLSNPEELRCVIRLISNRLIKKKTHYVDYLFNVAGLGGYANSEYVSEQMWDRVINVNLRAPFLLTKNLIPELSLAKRPRAKNPLVINFGSGMGIMTAKDRVAYCASKFGLRGMSLTLSKEFREKKIDVVLLTLGSIMTNFGTGGLAYRKEQEKLGKKYLSITEVIKLVLTIMSSKKRKAEYSLYPKGYKEEHGKV